MYIQCVKYIYFKINISISYLQYVVISKQVVLTVSIYELPIHLLFSERPKFVVEDLEILCLYISDYFQFLLT